MKYLEFRTACLAFTVALLFIANPYSTPAQEEASATPTETVAASALDVSPTPPDPNVFTEPKVTPIKGGYHFEWPRLTSIGAIQLAKPVSGTFEIQFDLRPEDVGRPPVSVSQPEVILPLADYWIVRGKPERAIPLYRLGLEKDPNNLLFLNNLAMLLADVDGKQVEALNVVDGALEERRDNVTLLDTKGLILMKDGRADEAIPHLERAVELSCQLPIYCMHLAKALDQAGRENSARNWFDKARPLLESTPGKMTKDNKEMFDQLRMKYAPSGAGK